MLIHLGERKSIFSKEIVAILDLSREPIRHMLDEDAAYDPEVKSCLITGSERIYNAFSAKTLKRRATLFKRQRA